MTAIRVLTLLLFILIACHALCDNQSINPSICRLSVHDTRSTLLQAVNDSDGLSINSGLQALIDRLHSEDVDGSVLAVLTSDDLNEFVDNQSISTSTVNQLLQLRDSLLVQVNDDQAMKSSSVDISMLVDSLSADTKQSFESLSELINALPNTRLTSRPYTGKWSYDSVKRTISKIFQSTNRQSINQRPRVVVVLGEALAPDVASAMYSLAPDVIVIQIIDQSISRTPSDSPKHIENKISNYMQSIDWPSTKLIKKRGPSANFVIALDHRSFSHVICVLMHQSINPDAIYLAHSMFPWTDQQIDYCLTQSNAIIFGSEQIPKPMLHHFSQSLNRRVYLDAPMFVVSDERFPELSCKSDGYGHQALHDSIPLVTLYMILKDEAGGIENTMISVLPYIDQLVVLDTGSTDGTPQLIADQLEQHPNVNGRIYQGSFVDFATTRNEALYLASNQPIEHSLFPLHNNTQPPLQNSIFLLMMNGDDELINGPSLRAFLSVRINQCGPTEEMMLMSVDYEGRKLAWSERIMRSSNHRKPNWPYRPDVNHAIHLSIYLPTDNRTSNAALHKDFFENYWHYEGLTHEVYTHPLLASGKMGEYAMTYSGRPTEVEPFEVEDLDSIDQVIANPFFDDTALSFHIWHTYVRDTKDKLRVRAAKDARLLLSQLETRPGDTRTMFYLSHSYDVMDDFHNAYHWHLKRTENIVSEFKQTNTSSDAAPLRADNEECTCLLRLGKIAAFRLPDDFGWSVAEPWFDLARTLCPDQIESRFYLAQHAMEIGKLQKALAVASEADKLIKNKRGLMHVLEAETVHQQMPQLIQHLRSLAKDAKQKKNNKNDL